MWLVDGRELRPVDPAPTPARRPTPAAELLRPLLVDAGLEVVVEDGILRAEIIGLEVARIVPADDEGDARLEGGGSPLGREAFAMVDADLPRTPRPGQGGVLRPWDTASGRPRSTSSTSSPPSAGCGPA